MGIESLFMMAATSGGGGGKGPEPSGKISWLTILLIVTLSVAGSIFVIWLTGGSLWD